MPKDYYVVLGVSRGADLNKIKRAYRKVVKEVHPDVARSREDAERFREVREAYETLMDEGKRQKYDETLSRQGSALRVSRVPEVIERRRSPVDEMERAFFSVVDDFFGGFIPGFFDEERGRAREKDLYYEAVLSPEEAEQGGLYPVSVGVMEPCARCRRSGLWEGFFCPICLGYGRVRSERRFSLSIPPHVGDGTRIRVSMEDIGLRGTSLNILVRIDPALDEALWA